VRNTRIAILAALVALAMNVIPAQAPGEEPLAPPPQQMVPGGSAVAGTVVSTMDVSNYTYVEIDTGKGIVWAAAPTTEVKEGDMVFVRDASPMPDFYSASLDRRFEMIYFGSGLQVHGRGAAGLVGLSESSPSGEKKEAEVPLAGIEQPEGGKTIGEIFEHKTDLVGEEVTVRGKVVKSNSGIMGRNWIHLQDGTSGPGGKDDLTVTSTSATAEVGSTVVVRGTLVIDQDFGYGYRYDLLIENAAIATE
jgi:hypothetical protein